MFDDYMFKNKCTSVEMLVLDSVVATQNTHIHTENHQNLYKQSHFIITCAFYMFMAPL